jgi:hypothetical protein
MQRRSTLSNKEFLLKSARQCPLTIEAPNILMQTENIGIEVYIKIFFRQFYFLFFLGLTDYCIFK